MRSQHDTIALWFGVGVLGLVIMAASFVANSTFLSPGPLSTSHSSVGKCSECHSNMGQGQFGWLHALVQASNPAKDSATCAVCHKIGKGALGPHGLTPQTLQAMIGPQQADKIAASDTVIRRAREFLLPVNQIRQEAVYCATCHREHRGSKVDMATMSNQRCQTCHQIQFTQFDTNHPEFQNYPFKRRTRLKFNHAAHIDTHFLDWQKKNPKGSSPDTCTGCHTATDDKRHMRVKPFSETCATCHLDQIVGKGRASGPQGVALLTLPGIDVATIEEKGLTIGEWPQDSEAEITPFMKLLLGGSAERRTLLASVENLDLLDLTKASDAELNAVVRLTWEIKRLLHGLMATKASEVMSGLRRATGVNVDQQLMTKLVATLPRDVLVNAQREWLPNLNAEVEKLHSVGWAITRKPAPQAGAATAKVEVPPDAEQPPSQVAAAAAPEKESAPQPEAPAANTQPTGKLPTKPNLGNWVINAVGDLVQEGAPGNAPPADNAQPEPAASPEPEQPSPTEAPSPAATAPTAAPDAAPKAAPVPAVQSAVSAEAWAEFGGWYRNDFAILYKPIGHADTFMRAWLDFSAQALTAKGASLATPVFELLTDKDAQGQCIKCHSLDQDPRQARKVQWRTSSIADKKLRFTKFIHEPHFGLLDNRGCLTCHEIGTAKQFKESYKSPDPRRTKGGFKQTKKALCATCHKASTARQDCLLCHKYHASPIDTPITISKFPIRK